MMTCRPKHSCYAQSLFVCQSLHILLQNVEKGKQKFRRHPISRPKIQRWRQNSRNPGVGLEAKFQPGQSTITKRKILEFLMSS
eukprot:5440731-Karenia_brevis.AAC.1